MSQSKILAALLLSSFAAVACAESNVTLYGTIDGAVAVQKAKGKSTTVTLEDGIAGGSVWGLTGEEDLGNGYSVNFTLENGFTMDNGASGEEGLTWSKQATLGVSGGFGELAFGRMGGLSSYEGTYSIWDASPFGTDYLQAGLGSFTFSGAILNNSIIYVTPEFGSFKGHLQYSNGIESDTAKWSKNSHYYGIGLTFEEGALAAALMYERYDNKGCEPKTKAGNVVSFSVSYDLEWAKPYFGYQYGGRMRGLSDDYEVDGKGVNRNTFTLGAEIPLGGGTAKLAANYAFGKIKGDVLGEDDEVLDLGRKKFDQLGLGVGYEYPLSKRTFVYGWGAWMKGGKALKNKEIRSDFESWSLGIGLHHDF